MFSFRFIVLYSSYVCGALCDLETSRQQLDWQGGIESVGLLQKHATLQPGEPRTPNGVPTANLKREAVRDFLRRTMALDPTHIISHTAVNNLGGLGPETGAEQAVVYDNVGFLPDGRAFNLRFKNVSEYKSPNPDGNTIQHEAFAQLNLAASSHVNLVADFVAADSGQAVTVPNFWIAVADLDAGQKLTEIVKAKPSRFWYSPSSPSMQVDRDAAGNLWFHSNVSKAVGNPTSVEALLDPKQEYLASTVILLYEKPTKIELTLEVQGGNGARNFMFLGGSEGSPDLLSAAIDPATIPASPPGEIDGKPAVPAGGPALGRTMPTLAPNAAWPPAAPYQPPSTTVAPRPAVANATGANASNSSSPAAVAAPPVAAPAPVQAHPTIAPGVTICASTRNDGKQFCPECVFDRACFCTGWVRLGYGTHWTKWEEVAGFVSCETGSFGDIDPVMNHGKLCQCSTNEPEVSSATEAEEDTLTTGWWKPVFFTTGFAIPIASALGLFHVGCLTTDSMTAAVLEAGAPTAGHATMLAVAFILSAKGSDATLNSGDADHSTGSLRRVHHSGFLKSKTRVYPDFAEDPYENVCCYVACVAFIVQVFARLYYEYLVVRVERWQQDVYVQRFGGAQEDEYKSLRTWKRINHFATAVMYIALIVLIVGAYADYNLMLTTAEFCALALLIKYFCVHLVFYVASLEVSNRFAAAVAKLTALNLAFAPMVALLCLTVQVQADSNDLFVQSEQEGYMKTAAIMVLVQAFVATLQPLCFNSHLAEVGTDEEEDLVIKRRRGWLVFVSIIRWLQIAYLYYVCYHLIAGLWSRADSTSKQRTQWMSALAFVFFTANVVQWTTLTLRQFRCVGAKAVHVASMLKELASPLPVVCAAILGWWTVTPGAVPW